MATNALFNTATDEDWLTAELKGGQTYEVVLSGDVPFDAFSAFLFVFSDVPDTVENWGGSVVVDGTHRLVSTPQFDSRHFIQAAYFGQLDEPLQYSVSVLPVDDDYADNVATTGVLALGQPAQGTIERAGDKDWFRAALQAGVTYQFEVTSASADPIALSARSNEDSDTFLLDDSPFRFEGGVTSYQDGTEHHGFHAEAGQCLLH